MQMTGQSVPESAQDSKTHACIPFCGACNHVYAFVCFARVCTHFCVLVRSRRENTFKQALTDDRGILIYADSEVVCIHITSRILKFGEDSFERYT